MVGTLLEHQQRFGIDAVLFGPKVLDVEDGERITAKFSPPRLGQMLRGAPPLEVFDIFLLIHCLKPYDAMLYARLVWHLILK
eukprot:2828189-Pleurochrysis_carterae.AAC.1